MKNKLPKVIKRKWLAALRSGKFKQGEGFLKKKEELLGKRFDFLRFSLSKI